MTMMFGVAGDTCAARICGGRASSADNRVTAEQRKRTKRTRSMGWPELQPIACAESMSDPDGFYRRRTENRQRRLRFISAWPRLVSCESDEASQTLRNFPDVILLRSHASRSFLLLLAGLGREPDSRGIPHRGFRDRAASLQLPLL